MILILLALVSTANITMENSTIDNSILTNLPKSIVDTFFQTISEGLKHSTNQLFAESLKLLSIDPDISQYCAAYEKVMRILESLYTIALMLTGINLLISNSEKRANAKLWLDRIFIMIILLSFSFSIFKMILQINSYVSSSLYNNSLNLANSGSLIFSIISFSTTILTFMTLLARYLLVPFLLLLFPFAIFLYYLPFSKEAGVFLLKFIIAIVFMNSIDALLTAGLSISDTNLSGSFIHSMATMLSFGLIGFVNLIIFAIAVFPVVSGVTKISESILSNAYKIAFLAGLL